MQKIQEQDGANKFLERFYGFNDAVIRSISLRYLEDGSRNMELRIATRDSQTQDSESWVCVKLTVHGLTEILLRENAKTTNQVLSEGIHLRHHDGKFDVEFGGECDPPQTVAELQTSDAYAIGGDVTFEVHPY